MASRWDAFIPVFLKMKGRVLFCYAFSGLRGIELSLRLALNHISSITMKTQNIINTYLKGLSAHWTKSPERAIYNSPGRQAWVTV
jgi:hypothetical protein